MPNDLFSLSDSQRAEVKRYIAEQLASIITTNTAQATSITNLNAWATALATKLNADAGVTDVNYDTTPQS